MAEISEDQELNSQQIEVKSLPEDIFSPPSIDKSQLLPGISYSHFSEIPQVIQNDISTECVMGVDEAGRGPVLGMKDLVLSHDIY
jgi:ribonuclease H2 subunit A